MSGPCCCHLLSPQQGKATSTPCPHLCLPLGSSGCLPPHLHRHCHLRHLSCLQDDDHPHDRWHDETLRPHHHPYFPSPLMRRQGRRCGYGFDPTCGSENDSCLPTAPPRDSPSDCESESESCCGSFPDCRFGFGSGCETSRGSCCGSFPDCRSDFDCGCGPYHFVGSCCGFSMVTCCDSCHSESESRSGCEARGSCCDSGFLRTLLKTSSFLLASSVSSCCRLETSVLVAS